MTDKVLKLSSPAKSPLSIDEIRLENRYLRITAELSGVRVTSLSMTDSRVKLLSPAKSPLSIDEMLLFLKVLRTKR
jgi:hypothetical protein